MPKLTDTQLVILSAAAQRQNRAVLEGFFADWLPCRSRTYTSALASHRDGTRQRSDVVAV